MLVNDNWKMKIINWKFDFGLNLNLKNEFGKTKMEIKNA